MHCLRVGVLAIIILSASRPAWAQDDREPPVWPTVRYGWPERASLGVTFQPPLAGAWDLLIGSVTAGAGGMKAGIGVGHFGGSLMGGWGLQATILRTFSDPVGAPPHTSYTGVEAHVMAFNLGIRVGPAIRVSDRKDGSGFRWNVSLGFGF